VSLIRSAITYFGLVFTAGFALGMVRVLALVPRLGERNAELIETPFMLFIVFLAARRTVNRMSIPVSKNRALLVGLIGFTLIIFAELGVLFWARQQSVLEYIASRNDISGLVYLGSLILFATMPALIVSSSNFRGTQKDKPPSQT
jgi:hypothetical protein